MLKSKNIAYFSSFLRPISEIFNEELDAVTQQFQSKIFVDSEV